LPKKKHIEKIESKRKEEALGVLASLLHPIQRIPSLKAQSNSILSRQNTILRK